MNKRRLFRVPEISQLSGIPASSLYDSIKRGRIEALRLGAAVYIRRAEVQRLLGEPLPDDEKVKGAAAGGDEAA